MVLIAPSRYTCAAGRCGSEIYSRSAGKGPHYPGPHGSTDPGGISAEVGAVSPAGYIRRREEQMNEFMH